MLAALASGNLIADPQRRSGAKGAFATALMRVATSDGSQLVSAIAFGDAAEQLLALTKGAAVAISGRANINTWTDRSGAEKNGLGIVVDQIATIRPRRRPDAAPNHAPYAAQRRPAAKPSELTMANDPVDDLWPG